MKMKSTGYDSSVGFYGKSVTQHAHGTNNRTIKVAYNVAHG